MRQIGSLEDEALAERLVDYLKTIEISAKAEEDGDNWLIWVKDENHLDSAREALAEFKSNPEDQKYKDARQRAYEIRTAEVQRKIAATKNMQQVRTGWSGPMSKRAPIVLGLIIACIIAAVLGGGFGTSSEVDRLLMFVDFSDPGFQSSSADLGRLDTFYSLRQGQLWRAVTPIFLHGDGLHILFNLMWMYSLGGQLEPKLGKVRFIILVLATAAIPNLLQAYFQGPAFLGISGVVYGFFAFMWIRRRDGYLISQNTMIFVMVWFVLGFTPMMNHAVWAHGGGLLVGAAMAYLPDFLKGSGLRD